MQWRRPPRSIRGWQIFTRNIRRTDYKYKWICGGALVLLLFLYGAGLLLYFSSYPTYDSILLNPHTPIVSGKAAIVSLARDIGRHTVRTKLAPFLTRMGQMFQQYEIIIVESNSQDDTRWQLKQWRAQVPHVTLLLDSGQHDLAYWRNRYLAQVQKDASLEYMVVVDGDMVDISIEGVIDSLTRHNEIQWAALLANGQRSVDRAYYDVLATRADWNGHHFPVESLDDIDIGHYIRQFTVKIDASSDTLIPVHSGFGGIGIYKTRYLQGCEYCRQGCSIAMGPASCEHIPFHNCIAKRNGGRIFVNPKMVSTWHYQCADCCADLDLPCEKCDCAPHLENYTWNGVTYPVAAPTSNDRTSKDT